ncbi:Hypothetical protein POVR2_LOCUS177 [uncultured virus]|nr:Hypothetical protein POVR2_LOCUS177 [uncultured virus]
MQSEPRFFSNLFGSEVGLPRALLNEPFTHEDNGLHVDIVKQRPRFLFKIEANGYAYVIVGETRYEDRTLARATGDVPQKNSSNVSVVTVYDTYGLDVAYAYLKHLYTEWYDSGVSSWITMYLRGSLAVLRPEVLDEVSDYQGSILMLCSLLFLDVAHIDSMQPKLASPLRTLDAQLPIEILSLLLPSDRIAKSITDARVHSRCDKPPSMRQLAAVNRPSEVSPIYLTATGSYVKIEQDGEGDRVANVLAMIGHRTSLYKTWTLQSISDPDGILDLTTAETVGYPIEDYQRAFEAQGCHQLESNIRMLQDLRPRIERTSRANLHEISTWYMSLVGQNEEAVRRISSFEALKDELLSLIDETIALWYKDL